MSLVDSFSGQERFQEFGNWPQEGHQVHIWGCQTCSNTADSHLVYAEIT